MAAGSLGLWQHLTPRRALRPGVIFRYARCYIEQVSRGRQEQTRASGLQRNAIRRSLIVVALRKDGGDIQEIKHFPHDIATELTRGLDPCGFFERWDAETILGHTCQCRISPQEPLRDSHGVIITHSMTRSTSDTSVIWVHGRRMEINRCRCARSRGLGSLNPRLDSAASRDTSYLPSCGFDSTSAGNGYVSPTRRDSPWPV